MDEFDIFNYRILLLNEFKENEIVNNFSIIKVKYENKLLNLLENIKDKYLNSNKNDAVYVENETNTDELPSKNSANYENKKDNVEELINKKDVDHIVIRDKNVDDVSYSYNENNEKSLKRKRNEHMNDENEELKKSKTGDFMDEKKDVLNEIGPSTENTNTLNDYIKIDDDLKFLNKKDFLFQIPIKEHCDMKNMFTDFFDEIKNKNYMNICRKIYLESIKRNSNKIETEPHFYYFLLTKDCFNKLKSDFSMFYYDFFLCILKGTITVDSGISFIVDDLMNVHNNFFEKLINIIRNKIFSENNSANQEDSIKKKEELLKNKLNSPFKEIILNSLHYLIEIIDHIRDNNKELYNKYKDIMAKCITSLEKNKVISYKEATTYIDCKNFDKLNIFNKELNKLVTKMKTKNIYSISVYNLMRENITGYSKIIFLLENFFSNNNKNEINKNGINEKNVISNLYLKYKNKKYNSKKNINGKNKLINMKCEEKCINEFNQISSPSTLSKENEIKKNSEVNSINNNTSDDNSFDEHYNSKTRNSSLTKDIDINKISNYTDKDKKKEDFLIKNEKKYKSKSEEKYNIYIRKNKKKWKRHLNCYYCNDLLKLKRDIFAISGLHNLCPRRILSILLFYYEQNINNEKQLLPLFYLYSKETITDIIILELKIRNSYLKEIEKEELIKLKMINKNDDIEKNYYSKFLFNANTFLSPNYFKMCSILILNNLLNINIFYAHITPSDLLLKNAFNELYKKFYNDYENSHSNKLSSFFYYNIPFNIHKIYNLYEKVNKYCSKNKNNEKTKVNSSENSHSNNTTTNTFNFVSNNNNDSNSNSYNNNDNNNIDNSNSYGNNDNNSNNNSNSNNNNNNNNNNNSVNINNHKDNNNDNNNHNNNNSFNINNNCNNSNTTTNNNDYNNNSINNNSNNNNNNNNNNDNNNNDNSNNNNKQTSTDNTKSITNILEESSPHLIYDCVLNYILNTKNFELKKKYEQSVELNNMDAIEIYLYDMLNNKSNKENFIKNFVEREIKLRMEVNNSEYLSYVNSYNYLFLEEDSYFFILSRIFFMEDSKFLFLSSLIDLNAWNYIQKISNNMAAYNCNPFLNYYVSSSFSKLINYSISSFEKTFLDNNSHNNNKNNNKVEFSSRIDEKINSCKGKKNFSSKNGNSFVRDNETCLENKEKNKKEVQIKKEQAAIDAKHQVTDNNLKNKKVKLLNKENSTGACFFCNIDLNVNKLCSYECIKVIKRNKKYFQNLFKNEKKIETKKKKIKQLIKLSKMSTIKNEGNKIIENHIKMKSFVIFKKLNSIVFDKGSFLNSSPIYSNTPLSDSSLSSCNSSVDVNNNKNVASVENSISNKNKKTKDKKEKNNNDISLNNSTKNGNMKNIHLNFDTFLNFFIANKEKNIYIKKIKTIDDFFEKMLIFLKYLGYFGYIYKTLIKKILNILCAYVKSMIISPSNFHKLDNLFIKFFFLCLVNDDEESKNINEEIWNILSLIPVSKRYNMYFKFFKKLEKYKKNISKLKNISECDKKLENEMNENKINSINKVSNEYNNLLKNEINNNHLNADISKYVTTNCNSIAILSNINFEIIKNKLRKIIKRITSDILKDRYNTNVQNMLMQFTKLINLNPFVSADVILQQCELFDSNMIITLSESIKNIHSFSSDIFLYKIIERQQLLNVNTYQLSKQYSNNNLDLFDDSIFKPKKLINLSLVSAKFLSKHPSVDFYPLIISIIKRIFSELHTSDELFLRNKHIAYSRLTKDKIEYLEESNLDNKSNDENSVFNLDSHDNNKDIKTEVLIRKQDEIKENLEKEQENINDERKENLNQEEVKNNDEKEENIKKEESENNTEQIKVDDQNSGDKNNEFVASITINNLYDDIYKNNNNDMVLCNYGSENKINNNSNELKFIILKALNKKYPDVMSGYIFDLDYIQKLIEIYGGTNACVNVQELNEDQLNAQCGFKLLKEEIMILENNLNLNINNLDYEYLEKAELEDEKLKRACIENASQTLINPNVIYLIFFTLSKLKVEYLFDSNTNNLRNLSSLVDKIHGVLLQFIEFLQNNCDPYIYLSFIPSITEIFEFFDISQSFHIIRFSFPFFNSDEKKKELDNSFDKVNKCINVNDGKMKNVDYYKKKTQVKMNNEDKDSKNSACSNENLVKETKIEERKNSNKTMQENLKEEKNENGMDNKKNNEIDSSKMNNQNNEIDKNNNNESMKNNEYDSSFNYYNEYKWEKLLMPIIEKYLNVKSLNGINIDFYLTYWRLSITDIYVPHKQYLKILEKYDTHIKKLENFSEENKKNEEYKWVHKKIKKLRVKKSNIKNEYDYHINHTKKIKKFLSHIVEHWVNPQEIGLNTYVAFIKCLIAPRILNSEKDALFCSKFIQMLLEFHTPLFNLCALIYVFTKMLMPLINACTEKEALNIGIFFNDFFSYIYLLCDDVKYFTNVSDKNPCFSYTLNFQSKDTIKHSCIIDKVFKWERIIVSLLFENNNFEKSWINSKSVVIFLFRFLKCFPYSMKIKSSVKTNLQNLQNFAQNQGWKDIVISIKSLITMMERNNRKNITNEKKEEIEIKNQENKTNSSRTNASLANVDNNITMNPFNTSNSIQMNSSTSFLHVSKNIYNPNIYPVVQNHVNISSKPYMKENNFNSKMVSSQDANNVISISTRNSNMMNSNKDNSNKRREVFNNNIRKNIDTYPNSQNALSHINDKNMVNKKLRVDNRNLKSENINYPIPQNFVNIPSYIPPPINDMSQNKVFSNMHNHIKNNRNSNNYCRR